MTLQDDYQAIREGAAIGAVSERAPLAVAGSDRASYLQGLLTNDIPALAPGTGCYAAWLTPQGRMLTDMHVLQSEGLILLDVPADAAAATLARLDQFLFSEDVQLESLVDSLASVWLHGPQAAAVIDRVVPAADAGSWQDYRHGQFEFEGGPVSVARIDQLGVPGFCTYVAPAARARLVAAYEAAGARVVSREALDAARIEAGYPVFGLDMGETTLPLEAGIEQRAISFTKGCYVGQEIVIRVLHRGGGRVAKKLVALTVDGDGCQRGAKASAGEREIGELTSTAHSPRVGPIALGYLHRDFVAPGTAVEIDCGGTRRTATVVATPMA